MEILGSGKMYADKNWLAEFVSGIEKHTEVVVYQGEDEITPWFWWSLRDYGGKPITYLGTPESFKEWTKKRAE